jgi:hypothetical protein
MAREIFSVSLTPLTTLRDIIVEHPNLEAHAGLYYMAITCSVL